MFLLKIIIRAVGVVLLAIGIVGILTPIPFGLVFIVLALLLLIPTTPAVANLLKVLRRRSARFDLMMIKVSARLPFPYRRILRQTEVSERF
ncbi:MAG: hypothetical protein V3R73_02465 [Sphingomonadales bacterium]